jgi:hypothetical protein
MAAQTARRHLDMALVAVVVVVVAMVAQEPPDICGLITGALTDGNL